MKRRDVTSAQVGSKSRRRRQRFWMRLYDCGCWYCTPAKAKKHGKARTTRERDALRDQEAA